MHRPPLHPLLRRQRRRATLRRRSFLQVGKARASTTQADDRPQTPSAGNTDRPVRWRMESARCACAIALGSLRGPSPAGRFCTGTAALPETSSTKTPVPIQTGKSASPCTSARTYRAAIPPQHFQGIPGKLLTAPRKWGARGWPARNRNSGSAKVSLGIVSWPSDFLNLTATWERCDTLRLVACQRKDILRLLRGFFSQASSFARCRLTPGFLNHLACARRLKS
jgi:hypothetical protein